MYRRMNPAQLEQVILDVQAWKEGKNREKEREMEIMAKVIDDPILDRP